MTSTCTVELENVNLPTCPPPAKQDGVECQPQSSPSYNNGLLGETGGVEPDPTPRAGALQKWNEPKGNMYRMMAVFVSFLLMGCNDSAYGPLIPYLEEFYGISHTVVSLVFLSPFVGYVASALLNNTLHHKFGQRGVAVLCSSCHLAAYIVICAHPPYVALVFAYILAGFGNGLADAAWNAWVGSLARSSELLGFIHAMYGVGGVITPLVSTAFITKIGLEWYSFYYLMIGLAVVEFATLISTFWSFNGAEYRRVYRDNEIEKETGLWQALSRKPAARVSWTSALFLLCYVGVEVALGGWIVLFMINVRKGEPFASGMSATGFWLGITAGRAVLGFVTDRLGVKIATASYIAIAMALQLIFWLVPEFYVSVVAVAFQGVFLGPLFPSIVLVANKLLPRHQHVVVIGFAAAFGGCGAAILPFVIGILAQSSGVQVLQPIILGLLGALLGIWLSLPRIHKKSE